MERCSENKPDMCSLCSVILSSPTVATSHYNGQTHRKNMEKEGNCTNFFCDICQIICTGKGPYQDHCSSKKHVQRCSENIFKSKMVNNGDISHLKSSGGYFDKSMNYDMQNSNQHKVDNVKGNDTNNPSYKNLIIKINDGGSNLMPFRNDSSESNSFTINLDNPCQILIKHVDKFYQLTVNQDRMDVTLQTPDRNISKTLISFTKNEITALKDERETFPLQCEICKKSFNGQQPAKEHFKSIAHVKKKKLLEESAENPSVFCKLCNVKCLDEKQMSVHLESQKHSKMKMKKFSAKSLEQESKEALGQNYKEGLEINEVMPPPLPKSCMSGTFFRNENEMAMK